MQVMMILRLAIADLWHSRILALCNIAAVIGIVAPLAVLAGIQPGVVDALISDLKSHPDILRVSVAGDHGFTAQDVDEVRGWAETGFVVPSSRAIARRLLVQTEGGGMVRRATLVPTGPGEPLLPDGPEIKGAAVAASDGLARRLDLSPGDNLQGIASRGQAGDASLVVPLSVAAVLPPGILQGEAVLMAPALMEDIEAFYDGYMLSHHAVFEGRPLSERLPLSESLRLYAADLVSVAALERQVEGRFGIEAVSRAAEVTATLELERRLGLALALIVGTATLGLLAALTASFWGMTRARRPTLATLALIGVPPARLAWYPVWIALATALLGLASTAVIAVAAAVAAEHLFGGRLPADASFLLPGAEAVQGVAIVLGAATASALLAAREAVRTDPSAVFRNL